MGIVLILSLLRYAYYTHIKKYYQEKSLDFIGQKKGNNTLPLLADQILPDFHIAYGFPEDSFLKFCLLDLRKECIFQVEMIEELALLVPEKVGEISLDSD